MSDVARLLEGSICDEKITVRFGFSRILLRPNGWLVDNTYAGFGSG